MTAFEKIESGERPEIQYDKSPQARERTLIALENFLRTNKVLVKNVSLDSIFFSLNMEDGHTGIIKILKDAENSGAISFSKESDEDGMNYEVYFNYETDCIPLFIPEFLRNLLEIFRKSIQSEVAGVEEK